MRKFSQKKNFTKRDFKLTESKLYYKITKFGDSNEVDVAYESINGDKVSSTSSNGFLLGVSIVLYIVGIMTHINSYSYGENRDPYLGLFWVILASILMIIYYFSRNNFWKLKLSNGKYVYFHKTIPNAKETDKFIESLIESRNQYLKENYAVIDENLGYEGQLNNLRWLKSLDVLSKDEFNQKYDHLKQTVKPDKSDIGFSK